MKGKCIMPEYNWGCGVVLAMVVDAVLDIPQGDEIVRVDKTNRGVAHWLKVNKVNYFEQDFIEQVFFGGASGLWGVFVLSGAGTAYLEHVRSLVAAIERKQVKRQEKHLSKVAKRISGWGHDLPLGKE
jgi:hypothetical protein